MSTNALIVTAVVVVTAVVLGLYVRAGIREIIQVQERITDVLQKLVTRIEVIDAKVTSRPND